jgi:hypothetical protein
VSRIFFSYSHKDEDLRDRLETQLAMLKRKGAIDVWHDRKIGAGDEFAGCIHQELERADVVLLLVSSDFLASNYCYDIEMARALERHADGTARVIPVILRPCDWLDAPFGKLMAAPQDGKPITKWPNIDDALLDVVQKIKDVLPKAPPRDPKPKERSLIVEGPRSSNLRIALTFSEADKDRFLEEAFEYIANFFEGSLKELQIRHREVETSFRRLDANRFTGVVYRGGAAAARCKIVLGGIFGRGISYSDSDSIDGTSFNDAMSVETTDQDIHLTPMGFGRMSGDRGHLTFEGAAEYYWSRLMEPLQRSR